MGPRLRHDGSGNSPTGGRSGGAAVLLDSDLQPHRPTADLAVLDVVLASDGRVNEDLKGFPTGGTVDLVGVHEGQSTGTRAFSSSPLVRSSRLSPLLPRPEDHRAKHEQGNDEDDEQFANHGLRNRQRVEQHRWDPTLSPP